MVCQSRDKMEDPVKITLLLERKDADDLLRLAGSESELSEYLARVIQRLRTERHLFGDESSLEEVVSGAEVMAQQNLDYKKSVDSLQQTIRRLAVSQEELLATVTYLQDAASEFRK